MSEREKSLSGSKFGKGSNVGLSIGPMSKQLVQSHIKSIMPSLRGGKKQDEVKYIRIRVQQNLNAEKQLQPQIKQLLNEFCGQFYDYKTFKSTDELLQEEITENDLFYIFLKEQQAGWGQKFARQQLQQSKGRKSIFIVEFLRKMKYKQKSQQRKKQMQKNRRDLTNNIIFYINSDDNYFEQIKATVIPEMDAKFKNKLIRQGDRIKTWAIAANNKQKVAKRERLYIYIEDILKDRIEKLYRHARKKNGFKWTQIVKFSSFKDILQNVKKREEQLYTEAGPLASQISIHPVSRILDISQSAIKSQSFLSGSPSGLAATKSVKNAILQKTEHNLRNVDKNFIIHSQDFEQGQKIYQYIMSQKDNNWQRVVYEQKNFPHMDNLVKQIQQNQKQNENEQYLRIIKAQTLYIITYIDDMETNQISNNSPNIFNNRYVLGYQNLDQLLNLLQSYARNDDNFLIVIIQSPNSSQEQVVQDFMAKNRNISDFQNLIIRYKRGHQLQSSLSMNSKLSQNDQTNTQKFLRAVIEDRDRSYDPFNCYDNSYVYILYRIDKEYLLDQELRHKIGESARLKKATYQDGNYLENFIKGLQRSGYHSIILTDDNALRQAQEVARKFQKTKIMNVTDRKRVKDQIKVLCWGSLQIIKQAIFKINDKFRVQERKQYNINKKEIFLVNPLRKIPPRVQFKQGNNITVKISSKQTNKESGVMQENLNHYFKQQIRIENYNEPKEVRLINKVQQPLTFIICRDVQQELQYMKKVAKQQKENITQEYIIYSQNPQPHIDALFKNDKYERFRFISNSWRRIQQYIIGRYQDLTGVKNEKIYQDELVHLFIHPNDVHLKRFIDEKTRMNPAAWRNIRIQDVRNLQWVALQQSPHHIYWILIDESSNNYPGDVAFRQIRRVEDVLAARKVPPKKLKMIIINKKTGIMVDPYVQASFPTLQKAVEYISNTQVRKPAYLFIQPNIIINRNQNNWYYFLNKNRHLNYQLHQIDKMSDILKLIENIRNKNAGAVFWYLTDNPKDLAQFYKTANLVEQGRQTYAIYHGQYPISGMNLPDNRLVMASSSRQQIQSFILNIYKRRPFIFPPQSLRVRNPIIAITEQSRREIPIHQNQITRWREDLGADYRMLGNINQVANFPSDKNIFWIASIDEERALRDLKLNPPNVWKIIYDSNQENRQKAHKMFRISPDSHQVYFGYYPAQITKCLQYLRYNIKNPAQKLKKTYPKHLTNIYIQQELLTNQNLIEQLCKSNHSISNFYILQSNQQSIQNSIKHVLSLPEYDNLFIITHNSEQILNMNPNKSRINYIIFDNNRPALLARSNNTPAKLLTDEQPEYITYLHNLPQNRYESAKKVVSKNPIRVMYLNNGKYEGQIQQLKQIMRRNPNFMINPYQNIADLKLIRQNIIVFVDQNDYQKHINELKYVENIKYFILGQDKTRNLHPDKQKSEIFITKDMRQLHGYYNNLRRTIETPKPLRFPTIITPDIVLNKNNFLISRPLAFKSNLNINKLNIYPPFSISAPNFNEVNFIDNPRPEMFNLPKQFQSDGFIQPQNLNNYKHLMKQQKKRAPLKLVLDKPLKLNRDNFITKPDNQSSWSTIYQKISKPNPRVKNMRLAMVFPDNKEDSKQFNNIYRVLNSNLTPKTFQSITPFTYSSDYEFENLYKEFGKKSCKFSPFDKTIVFLKTQMRPKYDRQLKQLIKLANKNNIRAEYYYFDDNFNQYYNQFRDFLHPYTIRSEELPYINKEDPNYWLNTSLYNVMVPLNKKKRYDAIKRNNIIVLPYTSEQDIQNQLHRNQQFVIIVCQKKDYHRFKKFPKISPRCIIVIEDNQQLKQDEVPLFRYPKKVLYYGGDALNYLQKIRIPSKCLPYKNQAMKVLFYKQDNPQERQYVQLGQFDQYQKVPYKNSQDLFIKLIQKFKTSSNFKVPSTLVAKGLIKLHPKRYSQKKTSFMDNYFNKYSTLQKQNVIEDQYKKSFESVIKPHQYAHLPLKQYDNSKELRQFLQLQQSPCLVYIDQNNRQHLKISTDFRKKHLFILMFDLLDIWINKKGYLIESEKLKRQELAVKQSVFVDMFNTKVFDTYNDMAYFYLSNTAEKLKVKGARYITFMTKEGLIDFYNNPQQNNTLMVLFVQHPDTEFIPKQFYDPYEKKSIQDRVKIIFIHHDFVHSEDLLYIKYNEIDPVIKHINRVEISSRQDFCIYPGNNAGRIKWHQFTSKHKGFQPYQYLTVNQMDQIASLIKGKYRQIYVICQKDQQSFIRNIFQNYSIKTKPGTGQKLKFWYITDTDNRSYMAMSPFSNIKPSNVVIPDPLQDNDEKFETAGQQIDIKINSKNKNYEIQPKDNPSSSNYLSSNFASVNNKASSNNVNWQDMIESKNFVVNLNQKLRQTFPIGNLYAHNIRYFKDIDSIDLNNDINQILITNQNYNQIKNQIENNPNLFLVYVNDEMPSGRQGKSFFIRQNDVPKFIGDLQGIQSGKKSTSDLNSPRYQQRQSRQKLGSSPPLQNYSANSYKPSSYQSERKLRNSPATFSPSQPEIPHQNQDQNQYQNQQLAQSTSNKLNPQNLQDFKVVRIFYDEGLDVQIKKQIFYAALKNKNFSPYLLKDVSMLKALVKQQGALSLLLISKDPPNLKQQLQKQNFTIIKSKRGKVIVPKYFNPSIDGLSTILQQDQSQFENIDKQNLSDEVDAFLKMMQTNPQKGRAIILNTNYESDKTSNKNDQVHFGKEKDNLDLAQQDSDKLNLHSNINVQPNVEMGNRQFIKTRLDGGLIVVFVDKNSAGKLSEFKKLNVLVQEYSHSINLTNNIRQKKDRFTIVLVQPNMLPEVKTIKQQYPKTVFVLVNPDKREIPQKDRQNITYTISRIEDFEPIIQQIYEQNEKYKYSSGQNGKIQSRMDNKRTSYVDNGNSWRFSTGYQNNRVKNAFVFYKQQKNKELKKKLEYLQHITFVSYKDFADAQKKLNSYSGYQVVLIANDNDIPLFEDYVLKKKQQAYLIKLNQPDDYRENPKIKKNILLSAFSDQDIANYLILKFGQNMSTNDKNQQKPKQGKSYAPRYQPNTFGTTPRFPSQKDYVPYKNDPIYSSRGLKSHNSRQSKVLKSDANGNRDVSPRYSQSPSPYYHS